MAFCNSVDGDLVRDIFITEAEIIDRYVGNQLWMWGENDNGRLGENSSINTNRSSPIQTVSLGTNWEFVSLGLTHSSAIKTDGTLWLWGVNTGGQLGDNSSITKSSPVQTVSTGTNWKQVSLGSLHSSAIKTDGTLWIWGCGTSGTLGNNSTINRSSPVQTVSAENSWAQVSTGEYSTSAIKNNGTLWLWGCNCFGRLGNNSTLDISSPIQTISTGIDWKKSSLGGAHSSAIKTDGTLWMWGRNSSGQLGNNSTIDISSPIQTVSQGTNWKQVALGQTHSAAIKIDGTLWVWGLGTNGRIGDNSSISKSIPVQTVSSGTNWKQIDSGISNSSAIKTDGTLWVWGTNNVGQIGDNSTIERSSPVQTVISGTNWKQTSFGWLHASAVTFTDN